MHTYMHTYIHTKLSSHTVKRLLLPAHVYQTELFGHREKMEHWGICPHPHLLKFQI